GGDPAAEGRGQRAGVVGDGALVGRGGRAAGVGRRELEGGHVGLAPRRGRRAPERPQDLRRQAGGAGVERRSGAGAPEATGGGILDRGQPVGRLLLGGEDRRRRTQREQGLQRERRGVGVG